MRSARIPPGFMNAICGVLPALTTEGSVSWASAMRLPIGVEPVALRSALMSAVMSATLALAIGLTLSL